MMVPGPSVLIPNHPSVAPRFFQLQNCNPASLLPGQNLLQVTEPEKRTPQHPGGPEP